MVMKFTPMPGSIPRAPVRRIAIAATRGGAGTRHPGGVAGEPAVARGAAEGKPVPPVELFGPAESAADQRVAQIVQAVRDGTYEVNASVVAERMLASLVLRNPAQS